MRSQVFGLYETKNVAGRKRVRIALAEQIADTSKHVAAIIKRHELRRARHRNSRFEVHDCHGIAADGHRERIENHHILVLIAKLAERNHDLARTSFFETEPAQRRRTAGEETLADRQ